MRSGRYDRVHPDGVFTARWSQGAQAFLIEVETRIRTVEVSRKIGRYSGYWGRLQKEEDAKGEQRALGFSELRPILFVMDGVGSAESMRDRVRNMKIPALTRLRSKLKGRDGEAEWFVLFGEMDEVVENPFGPVWMPLSGKRHMALAEVAATADNLRRREGEAG